MEELALIWRRAFLDVGQGEIQEAIQQAVLSGDKAIFLNKLSNLALELFGYASSHSRLTE
jgi:hypothetical protein